MTSFRAFLNNVNNNTTYFKTLFHLRYTKRNVNYLVVIQ